MQYSCALLLCLLTSSLSVAQTDSVIVTGRIKNLSARLYRESPTVLVSRNNVLQASRELVRPAPLNVDGTFRVAMPLIYPQEEMYFNYGRISTAFLAAPGTLTIDLDADSLFTTAVPFRFGGVNAQVNSQFARYKALEAAMPAKPNNEKLSEQVRSKDAPETYRTVLSTYQGAFRNFAAGQTVFPLVGRWIQSTNRYIAAGFVYDKAVADLTKLPVSLNDSLRPPGDRLLTASRAVAMNQFASYASTRVSIPQTSSSAGLSVRSLSTLLLRYGRNLTDTEQTRLRGYMENENTARGSDLRFFQNLVKRSSDTIQRLATYENLIQRSKEEFNEESVNYLTAYWLANSLPTLTLDFAKLLYSYARPQITDPQLAQSLDELYRLEVGDSVRVQAALKTLQQQSGKASSAEISPGVFVTRNLSGEGSALFDQLIAANRGKVIYVLLTSISSDVERQAALDAQRLRRTYRSRDFALIYLPVLGGESTLWAEFATKNNLLGDHLMLSEPQLNDAAQRLRPENEITATVINRVGKIVKRNAPLPGAFEEVRKVIEKNF
ncbi:hypothetical protein [Spirosoma utsteinense]|uniref:Thioredoxin domain-containing protein n=1 Tax=Spirosoma utsteinense TaxID=2585773 RepID=A0ABR6W2X0_9BACT|nr:hypothetical protein [Spirosoma utsteinense]MBC3784247.1 hypothetical protein [Spirosoma utsteinense]MBC3790956.1 hypothetical protein [Spirosoma utsteinense]